MGKEQLKSTVTLNDKYTLKEGKAFLTGSQALARLPLIRRWADEALGLNTAGFISGYRGSPLARLDQTLWSAEKILKENHITFTPGINEELGATAVWGSQLGTLYEGHEYDGVFGMWYGKGPGVDRSIDCLKHAHAAGTDKNGGYLAIVGDDHACISSTLGHQSEQALASADIPTIYPASIEEYLEFGMRGFEMSRYTGGVVGLKCVAEIVESSASVTLKKYAQAKTPKHQTNEVLNAHAGDNRFSQEKRLKEKHIAAKAFAKANKLDQQIWNKGKAELGIITAGKTYLDVITTLAELGIEKAEAEKLGIHLYKVGMVWPLEETSLLDFCKDIPNILVIEEKRPTLEDQIKRILFDAKLSPNISGKDNLQGQEQLPVHGELNTSIIAKAIYNHLPLKKRGDIIKDRIELIEQKQKELEKHTNKSMRLPFYCSGCPHNTSTKVPEGSRGLAGIGCHFMVMWMNRNTEVFSQMGGEGVQWLGQAPFTKEKHVFANLGDGTYEHSGILAIRAAVASKVNITYKILYNDAVAMTGGQPVEGGPSVHDIAWQLFGERVQKIYIVSDDIEKYKSINKPLPITVQISHRDHLSNIENELKETDGTTVIIYDQTCAAEKRRRRKRGLMPDPDKRIFINDDVCEGCGDCSVQSNCVAIEPKETELGRKRQINQSSCNKDFSCLKGFCPSFVTVYGGKIRKTRVAPEKLESMAKALPLAKPATIQGTYDIAVTGIGGTGVMTIGAILGMAAHIEGKGTTVLDQTGLSQKNGAVSSHIKIAKNSKDIHAVRISNASANLLLGCDNITSATGENLRYIHKNKTQAVINSHYVATASFTLDTSSPSHIDEIEQDLQKHIHAEKMDTLDATSIATKLMGDAIATNMFILGYAIQKGLIPVELSSIEKAIELNGVAINANKQAITWGRLMAYNPEEVLEIINDQIEKGLDIPLSKTTDDIIQTRYQLLCDYQNKKYADKYSKTVEKVKAVGSKALTETVSKNLYKVMVYKDEYEVARLYSSGTFKQKLRKQFSGSYKIEFNLAPPMLPFKDATGRPRKIKVGAWLMTIFSLLSYLKGLRGTKLDIFGYSEDRKLEKQIRDEYFGMLDFCLEKWNAKNEETILELLNLPQNIKGFGPVKHENFIKTKEKERTLLAMLNPKVSVKIQ